MCWTAQKQTFGHQISSDNKCIIMMAYVWCCLLSLLLLLLVATTFWGWEQRTFELHRNTENVLWWTKQTKTSYFWLNQFFSFSYLLLLSFLFISVLRSFALKGRKTTTAWIKGKGKGGKKRRRRRRKRKWQQFFVYEISDWIENTSTMTLYPIITFFFFNSLFQLPRILIFFNEMYQNFSYFYFLFFFWSKSLISWIFKQLSCSWTLSTCNFSFLLFFKYFFSSNPTCFFFWCFSKVYPWFWLC